MQWYYCTSFNCLWVPPCLRISAGSAACRFSQSQSELPRASSGGSGGLLPNPFVVESSHNGCAFTYIPNCDSLPGTLGWHLTLATSSFQSRMLLCYGTSARDVQGTGYHCRHAIKKLEKAIPFIRPFSLNFKRGCFILISLWFPMKRKTIFIVSTKSFS